MRKRDCQLNLPPMEVANLNRSRLTAWVAAWREVFRRHDRQKSAAITLGISEQLLSEQLRYDGDAHVKHLSVWRLHEMPPDFWSDVIDLIAEFQDIAVTKGHEPDAIAQAVVDLLKAQAK